MKNTYYHTNADCIDCGAVNKTMIRVGAFAMCVSCADKAFPQGYDPKTEEYKQRLIKYYALQ